MPARAARPGAKRRRPRRWTYGQLLAITTSGRASDLRLADDIADMRKNHPRDDERLPSHEILLIINNGIERTFPIRANFSEAVAKAAALIDSHMRSGRLVRGADGLFSSADAEKLFRLKRGRASKLHIPSEHVYALARSLRREPRKRRESREDRLQSIGLLDGYQSNTRRNALFTAAIHAAKLESEAPLNGEGLQNLPRWG
jgi:hypothetical protein